MHLADQTSLDSITRQLPQGFYTTFRTYEDRKSVLGLRAHLERLYQPAARQGIEPAVQEDRLRWALAELLDNYSDEARVRLILSGKGQIFVAVESLKPLPPEIYLQGVKVITADVERHNPRLKSTSFISQSQIARKKIAESQLFEALLVRKGRILEGMTSNFFYVKEGTVGTARQDILLGVTRRTVLRVLRGGGFEIVYQPLKLDQVPTLSEAFITSSSRGIVPIVQIDQWTVGKGRPGSITKQLMQAYTPYVLRAAEKI